MLRSRLNHGIQQWVLKGSCMKLLSRVSGILSDQRGLRTIAKVGGLVGKTMSIDESSGFKKKFARTKIAGRDVSLGLYIYDFLYERDASQ